MTEPSHVTFYSFLSSPSPLFFFFAPTYKSFLIVIGGSDLSFPFFLPSFLVWRKREKRELKGANWSNESINGDQRKEREEERRGRKKGREKKG